MRRTGGTLMRLVLLATSAAVARAFRTAPLVRFESRPWGMQQSAKRCSSAVQMSVTEAPPKTVYDVKQAVRGRVAIDEEEGMVVTKRAWKTVIEKIKTDPSLSLPAQFQTALGDILEGATVAADKAKKDPARYKELLSLLLSEAAENSRNLYNFGHFHRALRTGGPDFTRFGEEFFDITIEGPRSGTLGKENLAKIIDYVRQGHNIVLLANHQTEPDPYILRRAFKLLVDDNDPILEKLVFVAGAKVRTDLFTIPFSKGLNMICIHSKKYIEDDPETKPQKTQENLLAMKALTNLFVEGGHVIWVAPSGGRDRESKETGKMAVAPFDSRACDMFRVISTKSDKPTHFFPLSMLTYQVLPPPEKVAMEVGERRLVARKPVHLYFGDELTKERVVSEYIKRKADGPITDDVKEELEKKALKEGFSFVAEDDVKKHYDVLMALDSVLEEPEITVTYK